MNKYWKYWLKIATLSIQTNLEQRFGAVMFVLGKIVRFGFFLALIILVSNEVTLVSGYSVDQMIIFFLFFNLMDMLGQILFRGIYWFRQQIVSGEFDFKLVKPINPLFAALTGQTDILDIPLLVIVVLALGYQAFQQPLLQVLIFLVLMLCGLMVITAIHIAVAALGILSTEVDHTIMIFRDVSSMARFPTDIYVFPIRLLLTFVVPITVAYTIPAKALMGMLPTSFFLFSLLISPLFLLLSLKFWKFALQRYTSASS